MKKWTSITAVIVFDYSSSSDSNFPDLTKLPKESKQHMHMQIYQKPPATQGLGSHVVTFWGYLCINDKNKQKIVKFFERITRAKMVYSGILEIDVDGAPSNVFSFKFMEFEWEQIR